MIDQLIKENAKLKAELRKERAREECDCKPCNCEWSDTVFWLVLLFLAGGLASGLIK